MRFAEPQWLIAGAAVVTLLAVLLVRAERLRSRALNLLARSRLAARAATPSPVRRWARVVIATLAVAAGFVALARPQKGLRWETMERNGTDLMLVVDTSKSMDADDVKPTRLERTKLSIRDLVERFPGDRIGLVAFAGDAFVESPMTLDHAALLESVDALDTATIARGGTNVGAGIDVAAAALVNQSGSQKVMVLLTDGEDLEGRGLAEAKRAGEAGVTIETIGVGTVAGELVPARDEHGRTIGVVRDEAGVPVRSHLDEAGLKAIAEAGHGAYRPLGVDGRGLDRLYDESLAKLAHADKAAETRRVYAEWFEIPLAIALFGIVLDALLERRWFGLSSRRRGAKIAAPAIAAAAAFGLLLTAAKPAEASVESAAKAYAAGQFDDAAKQFEEESAKSPKDARLAFNAGDAAYRAGHYDAADAAYKRALAAADPKMQEHVLYNQGDTLYRTGAAQKPEARDATIANWKAAVAAYDGAIALDPKDQDAIYNRDFVKRKLAALEQKPKPDDQKKDDKKKDDQKKNDPKSGADDKQDKGSSGDKQDDKGAKGDKQQDKGSSGDKQQDKGAKGDKPDDKGAKGDKPSADKGGDEPQQNKADQGPKKGDANKGDADNKPSSAGAKGDDKAEPGHLSKNEARALLRSLKGDERHTVNHQTASGEPSDDVVGKDW